MKNPLRLWPGAVIVSLQWFLWMILPLIKPELMVIGIIGGLITGILFLVWWAFWSKAPRIERWGSIAVIVVSFFAASFFLDISIATANMGLMYIMYWAPGMCLAFFICIILTRNLSPVQRRIYMIITIFLASGVWALLRTNGMTGDGHHDIVFRWTKTNEDRLLSQPENEKTPTSLVAPESSGVIEWPGFRGKNRDGVLSGVKIKTNWKESPPVLAWRRSIGPGCSSFAIHGNLIYTQEQRGEYEIVSCYNLADGKPVWQHRDKVRFYDSHAGPGPRSTPLLDHNFVYCMGATGLLNKLDTRDGSVKWSRNAAEDANVKIPQWGLASSPVVVKDLVITSISGKLAAYDTLNGNPKWFGPDGGHAYSSPQPVIIDSVLQVLLMSMKGVVSIDPVSGEKLWEYPWEIEGRILQPTILDNGDLLISRENNSVRRISIKKENNKWTPKEIWTSSAVKPYFNDFVIHKNFGYGFDGPSMICIDLNNGKRMWRGERYRGFCILLEDQSLIVVLSEKGELCLVEANPAKFEELSKIQAINGKTWSLPAMKKNMVVLRNASEMAAYRLPEM